MAILAHFPLFGPCLRCCRLSDLLSLDWTFLWTNQGTEKSHTSKWNGLKKRANLTRPAEQKCEGRAINMAKSHGLLKIREGK